jgi:hypothetical protein
LTFAADPTIADGGAAIVTLSGGGSSRDLSPSSIVVQGTGTSSGIAKVTFPNGNVGIGTTNPLAKLHVNGDVTITSTGALTIPRGTTAQRPTNPVGGMIRYNNDEGYLETYDPALSLWRSISSYGVLATGGIVTEITVSGLQYKVHTFTSIGTSSFEVLRGGVVEYLIHGAGSGGNGGVSSVNYGNGGAAGVARTGTTTISIQTYSIIVGGGSPGTPQDNSSAGNNSAALGFTASGGNGSLNNGRTGAANADFNGGTDSAGTNSGGGAGAGSNGAGAAGGSGFTSSINGTPTIRGGGGGGIGANSSGGSGGGGNGSTGTPTSGAPNTGSGGGGGPSSGGAAGGSGIVIIRYRVM